MTIHPVWPCLAVPLLLGMAGMVIGSRRSPPPVRRERGLKSLWYAIIVFGMTGIALAGGPALAGVAFVIVLGGALEIARAALSPTAHCRPGRKYVAAALAAYALLSAGFLSYVLTARREDLLFLFYVVFCFDSFSQVIGQMLGRTRLAPRTSPNKTVEGFLGGLAAAVLAGWVASHWSHIAWWPARAILIALTSLAGDLAASHFKRRHGMKDFSNWMPHQGGFLDRFDSLIAAGAACGATELLFAPALTNSHVP